MEAGSDLNPPNMKSELGCLCLSSVYHCYYRTNSCWSCSLYVTHDHVLSHPQSQQNVGTKAFISERPDKTQMKLQTEWAETVVVSWGISCLKRDNFIVCSKNLKMIRSDRSAHKVTVFSYMMPSSTSEQLLYKFSLQKRSVTKDCT